MLHSWSLGRWSGPVSSPSTVTSVQNAACQAGEGGLAVLVTMHEYPESSDSMAASGTMEQLLKAHKHLFMSTHCHSL